MSKSIVFIGDVHGNFEALSGLLHALDQIGGIRHTVFLGDYVNKGSQSPQVLATLAERVRGGRTTLLRGNHEDVLLQGLESGHLGPFLKMGGAVTIRAYVGRRVDPDVWTEFLARIPSSHIELLRGMNEVYQSKGVVARHEPWSTLQHSYAISAHRPVGFLPKIGPRSASIDTGCGDIGGRLTALFWPSLNYLQADSAGRILLREVYPAPTTP